MRVLITGATGFVGRWLVRELQAAAHEPLGAGERVDVTDREALASLLDRTRPDAVVHLAAISLGPDAAADPAAALDVNVGGTLRLLEVIAQHSDRPVVLVTSSSEVYAAPDDDRPIDEDAPLGPRGAYGLTKVGQESVALAIGRRRGLRVIVARPFNHTGPGQREGFVVPALARRLVALREGRVDAVHVGNLDVRRDIGDVRDVVRAYRLLLERMVVEHPDLRDQVYNVSTGRTVAIRDVLGTLAEILDVDPAIVVDAALVRPNDPPVICGDSTRLRLAVGWEPKIPLRQTLADAADDAIAASSRIAPNGDVQVRSTH